MREKVEELTKESEEHLQKYIVAHKEAEKHEKSVEMFSKLIHNISIL